MALSLRKAAPLKPEIRLAQALSEFEAILADDHKSKFRVYRGQSPPNPTDVMRFTAEIDRDGSRNRKSRQCVGTRLTNVLHSIQQFSTVVDFIVGNSQSQIASAIWGTVRISLQLASSISSYFDQLSTLFMRIGLTCPRYQDFGLLYPESKRLQNALCEYFVVIVRLCKQAVLFLKKPFWSQLSSSILNPFESEFGNFYQDLENWAGSIREEVSLASNQAQQNEATEMSRFRVFAKKDLGEVRLLKRKEAELLFLNACSVYNYEKSWKQARKQGNTTWICDDERYKRWKREVSSTLWCTGMLGSGKTVLSANVVEDLKITTSAVVAYFFCRYDETESLQTRTIIGSLARQVFDHIKPDTVDAMTEVRSGTMDIDQVLDYIEKMLPVNSHKYFIVIDGLDECEEKESRLLLQCLKQLLMSKHGFQVYCSSRPDIFRWVPALLEPQWIVSISQTNPDIEEYIERALEQHLELGNLFVGDPTIIVTIRDALLENAHGMFLWVAFQIDSICSQKTDAGILAALEDLPRDLPETFNRILRKLQHSNNADPYFCKKIFNLMAAAQRPLTLEELREAVSIEPGNTMWDASKLVNDMLKPLLDSCGSLVAIEEEHLTVHFAHHSVKQHLLSEPTDLGLKEFHVNLKDADLYLGDIIVTYLNLGILDRRLTKANPTMPPQVINYPVAILGSLPRSTFVNKLAVRLLKSRRDSKIDIHSQLRTAGGIIDGSMEQTQTPNPFLSYAQECWLFHTKAFKPTKVAGYTLWQRLINDEVETMELPWAPEKWGDFGNKFIRWITQNEHTALIDLSLAGLNEAPFINRPVARLLLEFLEMKATEMNFHDISMDAALVAASRLGIKGVVLLSLKKGADTNASYGATGNALHIASKAGHYEIARLLLENGANINAESGQFGSALQAASANSDEKVVRLLLEHGANVNAEGGCYGTPLKAALIQGITTIVQLLLDHGANVNADAGNDESPLEMALKYDIRTNVQLLLDKGAIINGRIMEAAVNSRDGEVETMIRNALELQSFSIFGWTPPS